MSSGQERRRNQVAQSILLQVFDVKTLEFGETRRHRTNQIIQIDQNQFQTMVGWAFQQCSFYGGDDLKDIVIIQFVLGQQVQD